MSQLLPPAPAKVTVTVEFADEDVAATTLTFENLYSFSVDFDGEKTTTIKVVSK